MNPLPTLGVLGTTPRPLPGPLFRASRLADLERHAGALADAPYLVGHTAAAAFMGGVGHVAVASLTTQPDPAAVAAALELLLAAGATCLVAPGLTDLALQRRLVHAFEAWRDHPDAPEHATATTLWLDPAELAASAVIARRDALGGDRRAIWVVTPGVRALAPGRPRADAIPGGAVVGALALGSAAALGALVALEHGYGPEDATALASAGGIALLVPRGPRRLVGLQAEVPRVAPPAADPHAEEVDPIARAIQTATEALLVDAPPDAPPGPALEREARRVLRDFGASGAITAFAVRFEEGQLLVWYRTPQRVREVRVVSQRF